MSASSYDIADVSPSETASGGKAVVCRVASGCTLKTTIQRPAGLYNVAVQYFDIWRGVSRYELSLNGHPIAQWMANDTLRQRNSIHTPMDRTPPALPPMVFI